MTSEYMVRDGEKKRGPFSYQKMVSLMQEGVLQDHHFIRTVNDPTWKALRDVNVFSEKSIAEIFKSNPSEVGFRQRCSPRVPVNLPLFAHDESKLFDGRMKSLSLRGALVSLQNSLLRPNDEIMIHVDRSEFHREGFNIRAVVVRKLYDFLAGGGVRKENNYIIVFTEMPKDVLANIETMVFKEDSRGISQVHE